MRFIFDARAIPALMVGALTAGCSGPPSAAGGEAGSGAAADSGAEEAAVAVPDSAACPLVGSVTASPAETTVGGEVEVSVSVATRAGTEVSYTWTATDGEFLSSNVPATRFACTDVGEVTISVQVLGESQPDGGPCIETRTALVRCDAVPAPDASVAAVACTGSPGGVCSPTEEAFVEYDPTGACYRCLLQAECIDGAADGPGGNECDDLVGDSVTGPAAGRWKPSLCAETISCILSTDCANPSVVNCYCGGGDSAACTAPGAAMGACLTTENGGLETSDPATALGPSFTSKNLAAGVANAIFVCAAANHCNTCLGATTGEDAGGDAAEASAPLDQ